MCAVRWVSSSPPKRKQQQRQRFSSDPQPRIFYHYDMPGLCVLATECEAGGVGDARDDVVTQRIVSELAHPPCCTASP